MERVGVRITDTSARVLDSLTGAVNDTTGEGAGGCDAGLDTAGNEVVVWGHSYRTVDLFTMMGLLDCRASRNCLEV